MIRDFTYIDDVVESVFRVTKQPAQKNTEFDSYEPNPAISWAPYQIFNINSLIKIWMIPYSAKMEI